MPCKRHILKFSYFVQHCYRIRKEYGHSIPNPADQMNGNYPKSGLVLNFLCDVPSSEHFSPRPDRIKDSWVSCPPYGADSGAAVRHITRYSYVVPFKRQASTNREIFKLVSCCGKFEIELSCACNK